MRSARLSLPARTLLALVVALASLLGVAPALRQGGEEFGIRGVAWAQVSPEAHAQADLVDEAYRQISRWYVSPVDSAELMRAAWDRLASDARAAELPSPGPPPLFDGDSSQNLAAFRASFEDYLTFHGQWPEGFSPAYAAIRGMAAHVNEGHTFFLDPQRYQDHLAWMRGEIQYGGIGARMRSGDSLTISEVFKNSPAEKGGLRAGDMIEGVDGVNIQGLALEETIPMVRGPAGTPIQLVIRRPNVPEPFTVHLVREDIALDFVTSRTLPGNVGYISLRGFPSPAVVDQVEAAMADLQAQGIRALVFDLRGNSGGRIDVGERLLGHFLPTGTSLYQQLTRRGLTTVESVTQPVFYTLPFVVLVDGNTASMGEIFASAVQDHGAARVIGSVTAGNVAAGQVFPLRDGSALQITIHELLSAKGRVLNRVGVVPDEIVAPSRSADGLTDDPVVQRALAWLDQPAVAPEPVLFAALSCAGV